MLPHIDSYLWSRLEKNTPPPNWSTWSYYQSQLCSACFVLLHTLSCCCVQPCCTFTSIDNSANPKTKQMFFPVFNTWLLACLLYGSHLGLLLRLAPAHPCLLQCYMDFTLGLWICWLCRTQTSAWICLDRKLYFSPLLSLYLFGVFFLKKYLFI